ncbi:hypothetical protein FGB62_19g279 [Gracilaria domingensis]|nr:hypothetical protein FGB62_19g279 [Gracilaria domingensis]
MTTHDANFAFRARPPGVQRARSTVGKAGAEQHSDTRTFVDIIQFSWRNRSSSAFCSEHQPAPRHVAQEARDVGATSAIEKGRSSNVKCRKWGAFALSNSARASTQRRCPRSQIFTLDGWSMAQVLSHLSLLRWISPSAVRLFLRAVEDSYALNLELGGGSVRPLSLRAQADVLKLPQSNRSRCKPPATPPHASHVLRTCIPQT